MSAPWPSPFPVSVALTLCGLGGLGYGTIVTRRARRQTSYAPVWQDWLWYAIFPFSLYAALALFVVAGAALGLLLLGIHNAWDTVTHIVVQGSREVE